MSNQCKHGQLKRACNVCELEKENKELRELLEKRHRQLANVEESYQRERQCRLNLEVVSGRQSAENVQLIRDASALREQLADYQHLFDLQHKRAVESLAIWRKANPGNDLRIPDIGVTYLWLLDQARDARAEVEAMKKGVREACESLEAYLECCSGIKYGLRILRPIVEGGAG